MTKETVNIFYRKRLALPFIDKLDVVRSGDYTIVCSREILRAPGHTDDNILDAHFELFNWVHEGFQPTDPEVGFNRGEADHTSMSVGDIIEINGKKYICDAVGWKEVKVVA